MFLRVRKSVQKQFLVFCGLFSTKNLILNKKIQKFTKKTWKKPIFLISKPKISWETDKVLPKSCLKVLLSVVPSYDFCSRFVATFSKIWESLQMFIFLFINVFYNSQELLETSCDTTGAFYGTEKSSKWKQNFTSHFHVFKGFPFRKPRE